MRAVIERVSASVSIANHNNASIAWGLLVFIGIEETDGREDVEWRAENSFAYGYSTTSMS